MRFRSRKTSRWKSLPLWVIALGLIGWGIWQAMAVRRAMLAQAPAVTTHPAMAINGVTVMPVGAQGGEPWTMTPDTHPDGIDDTLVIKETQEVVDQSFLEPTPGCDPALSADELFAHGKDLLENNQMVAGRFALNAALARSTDEAQAEQLRGILANLNIPVFMGTAVLPDDPCVRYVDIRSGDTFLSLARTYGVTSQFLQRINPSLNPNNLKVLTGIKVVQGPFHVRISKRAGRLDLYARDIYVASCAVDFPEGNYLPKGDYQVTAGTKLLLGSRIWIGFEGREEATEGVANGWLFGSAGPRGSDTKNRATGVHMADSDLAQLYLTLAEARSHIRIDP
jgi:hypothetical protein